jgi:hypothetical protein
LKNIIRPSNINSYDMYLKASLGLALGALIKSIYGLQP